MSTNKIIAIYNGTPGAPNPNCTVFRLDAGTIKTNDGSCGTIDAVDSPITSDKVTITDLEVQTWYPRSDMDTPAKFNRAPYMTIVIEAKDKIDPDNNKIELRTSLNLNLEAYKKFYQE